MLSVESARVYVEPMLLGNFDIIPHVTLCNNALKQTVQINFSQAQDEQTISNLYIHENPLTYQSPNSASVQLYLPCKKNMTYYKFKLYSRDLNPTSLGNANILSLSMFNIVKFIQINEKLYFQIDREIEFEVLTKSFTLQCILGNSGSPQVYVNEFHQFYCNYDGTKIDQQLQALQIVMNRSDSSNLLIAQSTGSFSMMSLQNLKAMLAKNLIIGEIEDSFEIEIKTDLETLSLIQQSQVICKVTTDDCTDSQYVEASINGYIVTCFAGATQFLSSNYLSIAMIVDQTEIQLSGNNKLITTNVSIIDINPKPHFFIGTTNMIQLQLSQDLSNFGLNCIIVNKANSDKYIITAVQNQTVVDCTLRRSDLGPGNYWISLGLKDSSLYLNQGKSSITVYERVNITEVNPRYLTSKMTNVEIRIFGTFSGVISYYGNYKSLASLAVQIDSLIDPIHQVPSQFPIYTLTESLISFIIPDMNKIQFDMYPTVSQVQIIDTMTNKSLSNLADAIVVIQPVLISSLQPQIMFSNYDTLLVQVKLESSLLLTHCIQVIDEKGTEIVSEVALSNGNYQCLIYKNTVSIQLGIQDPGSTLISTVTDSQMLIKRGPVYYTDIQPINGPMSGGTVITVKGVNFLTPIGFNVAIMCRFSSFRVLAQLIDSHTLTCLSPHFSKVGPIQFTLETDDPLKYYMITKSARFFYEDNIEIDSVTPSFVDLSQSFVKLHIHTLDPVISRTQSSISCKIIKDIEGTSSFQISIAGYQESSDDSTLICLLPTYALSNLLSYRLTISSNGGIDYSQSFYKLVALPSIKILSPNRNTAIVARRQALHLTVQNLEYLSSRIECLFTSHKANQDDTYYSFEATIVNMTTLYCDVYPISSSQTLEGFISIKDVTNNVTSINSIAVSMIRDKILIQEVSPSAYVHLIPNTTLVFNVALTESVTPADVSDIVCSFSNQINKRWYQSAAIYMDQMSLQCILQVPLNLSLQIYELYKQIFLQVQHQNEMFSETKYAIQITNRPVVTSIIPNTLDRSLQYNGQLALSGANFNDTVQVFIQVPVTSIYLSGKVEIYSEYINQTYLVCNLTSQADFPSLLQYPYVVLTISNNYQYQFSEEFQVPANDVYQVQNYKFIRFGNSYPLNGPYQGGSFVYFIIEDTQNFQQQDYDSLFCNFESVDRTKVALINETFASCVAPTSSSIQSVQLSIISTSIDILVASNQEHFFTFIPDNEFYSVTPSLIILNRTKTNPIIVLGKNFNASLFYSVVLTTLDNLIQYELAATFLDDQQLQFQICPNISNVNRKLTVALLIKGNDQFTKYLTTYMYLVSNPRLSLVPSDQFILRGQQGQSYISLVGTNVYSEDLTIQCLFTLYKLSSSFYNVTQVFIHSTVNNRNGSITNLQCLTPSDYILPSLNAPNVSVQLVFTDIYHQSLSVSVPVVMETQIQSFYPIQLDLGTPYVIEIRGSNFRQDQLYSCLFNNSQMNQSDQQLAQYISSTLLQCDVRPLYDVEGTVVLLEIFDLRAGNVIGSTDITFTYQASAQLYDFTPKTIFQNTSGAYLDITGQYFLPDCQCMFGQVVSPQTNFISSTEIKCLVPYVRDRNPTGAAYDGFDINLSLNCPISLQKSQQTLTLFMKFGTIINQMSRSYVRENQNNTDSNIYLSGQYFYSNQICVLSDSSGYTVETPLVQFITEETVVCLISGNFYGANSANAVQIYIKDYNQQNQSIVFESNSLQLNFLPLYLMWANFNQTTEVFYLQETGQVVNIFSNIEASTNFTYYCIYQNGQYVNSALFDNTGMLTQCPFPYIFETNLTTVNFTLQEVAFDGRVSYSNALSLNVQPIPTVEVVNPWILPSNNYDTWVLNLSGTNFIVGQTRIFFGDIFYADVNVTSPTSGTFIAPSNISVGIMQLSITNNLLKLPTQMGNLRSIEFIKLPELFSVLPSTVATRDVTQKVIIQGQNFTANTRCYFDGAIGGTTYITSSILECDAPVALAGMNSQVLLKERNVYFNKEINITLGYYASPFVYRIEPAKAFRSIGTEVKVYISNWHSITTQNYDFQYCKFGNYTVQVSKIITIQDQTSFTNQTIFICKTPYFPKPKVLPNIVQVEILTDNGVFSQSINNYMEFIEPPIIISTSPAIAPLGVDGIKIYIEGGKFDPAYEYFCHYKLHLTFQNETKAFFITNDQLMCIIPGASLVRYSSYVNIRVVMKDLNRTFSYNLPATTRILFYIQPSITKLSPQNGDVSGGTEVYFEGLNFDSSYGGIKCRFGSQIVEAELIEQLSLLKCIAPPSLEVQTNNALVQVSVDGLNYFSGKNDQAVYFTYRISPIFTEVTPIRQSIWGEQTLLITGSNYPDMTLSNIICRFVFPVSQSSVELAGIFQDQNNLICSTPRHLLADDDILLLISFNNQEFFEVTSITNTLQYSEKAKITGIYPRFGFADQENFNTTLSIFGENLQDMTESTIGNFSTISTFLPIVDTYSKMQITLPQFVNISLTDNITTYGDNRAKVEVTNSIVGSSFDEITYTYINNFHLYTAGPVLIDATGDVVCIEGDGFMNTPALNCKFGNLLATSVKYYNRTNIDCGTPNITDITKPYSIAVTLNGIEYLYLLNQITSQNVILNFTAPITVYSIDPNVSFSNALDILITVQATLLLDLPEISCKIHDYITTGVYLFQNNLTYIQCIIPSLDYLNLTRVHDIPANNSIVIEVSNNGKDFSSTGLQFKFIPVNELQYVYPTTGPETGGTLITIHVADLPLPYNGTNMVPITYAQCFFPGYPAQDAIWVNEYIIQCTSPPLIENIGNVTSTTSFAVADVWIEIYGVTGYLFYFVYTKNLHVISIDPPNAYAPSSQQVYIYGTNFIPVSTLIQCKYYFATPLNNTGIYINNHTILCNLPPQPIAPQPSVEQKIVIEISLNGGIQYTSDGVLFTYRALDIMTSITPQRGFFFGNTFLTIGYSYFYDKSSIRQVCKFTTQDGLSSFSTRIISYDSKNVYCYTPPLKLISQTLASTQASVNVTVQISSNYRDYSTAIFNFSYDPVATITSLSPSWVIRDTNSIISIIGTNYFATSLLKVRLESSDGLRVAYLSSVLSNVNFVNSNLIQFTFPNYIFLDKDYVKVFLRFGEDVYFESAQRLIVYSPIVLQVVKPSIAYTAQDGSTREIFVYGTHYWDTQKPGHLNCILNGAVNIAAQYVNSTLVVCNIPNLAAPGQTSIVVQINNSVYSNNSLLVTFFNPPSITSMNVSSFYYTLQQRINVLVQGVNLAAFGYAQVNFANSIQNVTSTATSFTFQLPLGLDYGNYLVSVATDGINFVPYKNITVNQCPDGQFCTSTNAYNCKPGYYCPWSETFDEIKCPSGTIQPMSNSNTCLQCTSGTYCPELAALYAFQCPRGYICPSTQTISQNMMKICPDGFICPANITTTITTDSQVGQPNNTQLCPDGFWCAEGTFSLIQHSGLLNSPQQCRDEVICINNMTNYEDDYQWGKPGPNDQFGNFNCPRGSYCQAGLNMSCPWGSYCGEEGQSSPTPCPYGQYNREFGQTQCQLCPVGTFCQTSNTSSPTQCRPGYTCQFDGSPYAAQLCPAGSYCSSMTVTNDSFSSLQPSFKPNLCFAATYCLAGAYTPIVNSNDPQAAQTCQAGTYCRQGTQDPNGEGQCWPGYYCNASSTTPIPADPGFYSEGYGNEKQEPCIAGTYQDLTGSQGCKYCPLGFSCPNQQMTWPQLCLTGQYSDTLSQTQCTQCPSGTYSNNVGLTTINSCQNCQPKYYCPNSGMVSMSQAIKCQEGQYCGTRTTSEVMFQNNAPAGYYTDFYSAGLQDFYLCEPGYYCPLGTSITKYKQNSCLQGYYCPRGTAAEININTGLFIPSTVHQISSTNITAAIQGMLAQTLPVMAIYQKNMTINNAYTNSMNQTYYQLINKYNASSATRGVSLQNLTNQQQTISQYWMFLDNANWTNQVYQQNVTYIAGRQLYLSVLLDDSACPENSVLPPELVNAYYQNGMNLMCPNGTTSARGTYCIGQCARAPGANAAISVLDPINGTQYISSVANINGSSQFLQTSNIKHNRVLEQNATSQQSNNSVNTSSPNYSPVMQVEVTPAMFKSTFDVIQQFTIMPLQCAKVYLDFTGLPNNFNYNEHFAVIILDGNGNEQVLPFYFDPSNNGVTNKIELLEIRVFSWQQTDQIFQVAIYLYHGLFQPYLQILKEKINIVYYNANRQLLYTNYTYATFVADSIGIGITLPYNMPAWGVEPPFYLDMTATQGGVNPVTKGITKDVFDSTYWQEVQINANIMPWLPFFSNCAGQDSHTIFFDSFEYNENCRLPVYDDIQIVNPIPSTGLDPFSDQCNLNIQCIYDEPIMYPITSSTRWYAINTQQVLFYITKDPISIAEFRQLDPLGQQTAYYSLISEGSDLLIPVTFSPDQTGVGFPTVVIVNIFYYQETKEIKRLAEVSVYLTQYYQYTQQAGAVYTLQLNYEALSYFNLINSFQFTIPVYIILFIAVALIQVMLIVVFWLFTFICCPCLLRYKRSPSLRFTHMSRVLFKQPAIGAMLANGIAIIVAFLLRWLQDNIWFDNIVSNWSNWGLQQSPQQMMMWKYGRLGLALTMISCVFMYQGSKFIIYAPTPKQEQEIVSDMIKQKKKGLFEQSFDLEEDEPNFEDDIDLEEHEEKVTDGLLWKRRHFFINCFFIAIFFMLKLEFSYTSTFANNIVMFQVIFAILDIFIEMAVTRFVMGEALMYAPLQAVFTSLEFVMLMGANDFQSFIFSYFTEVALSIMMRTYIGPISEFLQIWVEQASIYLSMRFKPVERLLRSSLKKQLQTQLQLVNLAEYHEEDNQKKGRSGILQKTQGMEALLSSVSTYASCTQSMFIVPFILVYIILFPLETMIPQGYNISQRELPYYLVFSFIIIFPQMVIDVFLLHLLEVIWGYKVYDYFTYAEYKFRTRQKKYINQESFARSINRSWRSLDNMSFSSQYYFNLSLMSWGIVYLCLGMTTFIQQVYNPFTDPVLAMFLPCIGVGTAVVFYILKFIANYFKIWEVEYNPVKTIDVSQVNKLDKEYTMRVLTKNLETNPFRHKFIRVNRDWIIHNISTILGGKNYMKNAGPEKEFLEKIYQRAVNAHEIDQKLKVHFEHIENDLGVMPYNQMDDDIGLADQISDNSISDFPVYNWQIPFHITSDHIQSIAKQWIDFAKHNMRLKEMVSDIIEKKLMEKCQRCKSVFRLQVIQKVPFSEIVRRYRVNMVGVPFTRARWRRFYNKYQIFITMCMECAFLDNLKGKNLKRADNNQDDRMIAINAIKHVGSHNLVVQSNIKKKYVKNIIRFWIQLAKSHILHNIKPKARRADEDDVSSDFSEDNKKK